MTTLNCRPAFVPPARLSGALLLTGMLASWTVVPAATGVATTTAKPVTAASMPAPKAPKPSSKSVPPRPLSNLALQWLQEKCPNLIQPYELTGNVTELVGGDSWLERHNPLKNLDSLKKIQQMTDALSNNQPPPAAAPAPPVAPANEDWAVRAKRLNWLPMEVELNFGQREHDQENEILDRDSERGQLLYPKATAMLEEITRSMGALLQESHQTSPYEFKLFILKRDQHNAVARPGGFIYIDEGLLTDDGMIAKAHFALAHEIAHILQRHQTFELQSVIVDSFALKKDLRLAILAMNKRPASVLEHVRTDKGIYIRHHIDQELQADACGARLLAGVYPTSNGLAESIHAFLNDLQSASTSASTVPTSTAAAVGATPGVAPGAIAGQNAALQTVVVAEVSYDIFKTPLDQHPNFEERRQRLESVYHEIVTNGHESRLAAEK